MFLFWKYKFVVLVITYIFLYISWAVTNTEHYLQSNFYSILKFVYLLNQLDYPFDKMTLWCINFYQIGIWQMNFWQTWLD